MKLQHPSFRFWAVMKPMKSPLLGLLLGILFCPVTAGAAESAPVDYGKAVVPVLKKYCLGCHNAQDREGELNLERYRGIVAGGENGAVIVPGKSGESRMIQVLTGKAEPSMPPEDNEKPSSEEIALLAAWIDGGALGPDKEEIDPASLETPSIAPSAAVRESINAVAYNPSGDLVAVARYGHVELRSAADLSPVRRLEGALGRVTAVSFSADGRQAIGAAGEPSLVGEACVWNVADGSLVRSLRGHQDSLYAAALSPAGDLLATASYDQQIKLWDFAGGRELRTISGHNDAVFDLAFRPDGKILASASGDRTAKLWDVATGERKETFGQPQKEQYAVVFSPDGTRLAAGGVDNRIRVWQVSADARENANPILYSRFAHEGAIVRLVYSPDGKTLVSSAEDRSIKIWDAETVVERLALERQPDWAAALAISPDGRRLLVGRHDGTLGAYDLATGERASLPASAWRWAPRFGGRLACRLALAAREEALLAFDWFSALLAAATTAQAAAPPAKPELTPLPVGIQAGTAQRVVLTGKNLAEVQEVKTSDPRLTGRIVAETRTAERVEVELSSAPHAGRARHEIWLAAASGESNRLAALVDPLVQHREAEPNGAKGNPLSLPAGAWGTLADKGDRDRFAFSAKQGERIVLEARGRSLGSRAALVLVVLDSAGAVVETGGDIASADGDFLTAFQAPRDGEYAVEVADLTSAGSAEHYYLLTAGVLPYVTGQYPLSVPAGKESDIELVGYNVPAGTVVHVGPAAGGEIDVPLPAGIYASRRPLKALVDPAPEFRESEPNDAPQQATAVGLPATIHGRIWNSAGGGADHDLYRFQAEAGQTWILETDAARRGSPVDTVIEVLHADGRPAERLRLEAVRDSAITFRGINSTTRDVRCLNWEEMELNEYLYMNGEVCKLFRKPQGPDSGFLLFEGEPGTRRAYFDTSATVHAVDEPCFIVRPHPPGTKLGSGGIPFFTLYHVNDDDGGRRLGNDSHLAFTAPQSGTYLARVRDSRATGGESFSYRLVIRQPRPDFTVSLVGANPTVNAGSGRDFTVTVDRADGFDDAVRVDIGGLPPGFHVSTPLVIAAGHREAHGVIFADADAPAPTDANAAVSTVAATALIAGQTVVKSANNLGRIALGPKPALTVYLEPAELSIAPGTTIAATLRVERNGHDDLVTFNVLNLPHGVIIDNIGLNGVLLPKGETERQVFLTADAWVPETSRSCYAIAAQAGNQASRPVQLHVRKPNVLASAAGPVPSQ